MLSTSAEQKKSLYYFEYLLAFTHLSGFTTTVLNAYFFNTFLNGMAWPAVGSNKSTQLHGFLMIISFVFLQGEALLAYRVYRYNQKIISKLIHTILHLSAISIGILALIIEIINKNNHKSNHFTTVHSWIGIILLVVYIVQFTFGLFTYLCPCTPNSYRAKLMPIHRTFGAGCLLLGTTQSIIGHVQYLSWVSPKCFDSLTCSNRMEYVAYFSIISLIVYSFSILVIIVPQSWKRTKTPDELK